MIESQIDNIFQKDRNQIIIDKENLKFSINSDLFIIFSLDYFNIISIISIIRTVQENKAADPVLVFSKTLPLVHSVKRFGVNALTEIMNTFNPIKYSVANGRTLKSLLNLGFAEYPEANNFKVDTYRDYNTLITEIAIACQFKDLGQVDHFLSWYYENYVKK